MELFLQPGVRCAAPRASTAGFNRDRRTASGKANSFPCHRPRHLSLLPGDLPGWMEVAVLAVVAFNEFAWFALLALVFSGGTAQAFYRRTKRWLDRIMGGVLGLLGVRLLAAEV